ncbi:hypothetical protein P7C73_g3446, partial [Tremellales sp. Uapishka_1]
MAAISTPTSLATFPSAHASSSKLPHVTLSAVKGSNGKLAVAAVQGDGVWTYDLKTLRPTTSFTVPPSTLFSTPPISFVPAENVNKKQKTMIDEMEVDETEDSESNSPQRTTIVGIQKGEGVKKAEEGKMLWVWKGEEGGEKEVISVQHPLHSIHHLASTAFPILLVGSDSRFALLDASLQSHPVEVPRAVSSAKKASNLSAKIISSSAATSKLVTIDSRGHVMVVKVDHGDESSLKAEKVNDGWISSDGKERDLVFADISEEGTISAIDTNSSLLCLPLKSLASSEPAPTLSMSHPSSTPNLLSLPSTSKPLVLLPSSHPLPTLLLSVPLATLPAILASSPVSSFSSTGTITHLSTLAQPTSSTFIVGIVMSHKNPEGDGGRSVVYATEVSLPAQGVGLNMLLGTQEKTSIYLSSKQNGEVAPQYPFGYGESGDNIIEALQSGLKAGNVETTEDAWLRWLHDEDAKAVKLASKKSAQANLPEVFVKKILDTVFFAALPGASNDDDAPSRKMTGIYAMRVVRSLMNRRIVSDSMWKGGVVAGGLLPCKDWENITRCLKNLPTIPSSTLILLLQKILQSSEDTPPLAQFLKDLLAAPVPPPTFRVELRKSLSVEDATRVLEQYVTWAEEHVERRTEGISNWLPEEGVKNTTPKLLIPSLESLINHSSILLDSHLPLFLSYPPSHALLGQLQTSLVPLLAIQEEFRQLRAPVEAVLTLAKREERKMAEADAKHKASTAVGKGKGKVVGARKEEKKGTWGEEKIGYWKVEDFVF